MRCYFCHRMGQARYVTHHLRSTFYADDLSSHRARYGTYHLRSIDLVTISFCSNASKNSQICTWRRKGHSGRGEITTGKRRVERVGRRRDEVGGDQYERSGAVCGMFRESRLVLLRPSTTMRDMLIASSNPFSPHLIVISSSSHPPAPPLIFHLPLPTHPPPLFRSRPRSSSDEDVVLGHQDSWFSRFQDVCGGMRAGWGQGEWG